MNIRMSQSLRKKHGIRIGDRLSFRKGVVLTVMPAFSADLIIDESATWVSRSIYLSINDLKVTAIRYTGISIGCDPEFWVVNRKTGKMVPAHMYFDFHERCGTDADGWLGELRPWASYNAREVTVNLCYLIAGLRSVLRPEHKAVASSSMKGRTAGFHIHLGLPREIMKWRSSLQPFFERLTDSLIWYVLIPCLMKDPDEVRRRAVRNKYGDPRDYRTYEFTFEYRAPGAFWLRHPHYCRGLLELSQLVAEDVCKKGLDAVGRDPKRIRELNDIRFHLIPERRELSEITQNISRADLHRYTGPIHKELKRMAPYKDHAETIDDFFKAIQSRSIESEDIMENWLRSENVIRKKKAFPLSIGVDR
ncbi:MAG: hypothetical protein JRG73_11650 [Deltaproteobacteria bacterium]|nr:hypothetical protein [Deltaproteobacteria bacterium]